MKPVHKSHERLPLGKKSGVVNLVNAGVWNLFCKTMRITGSVKATWYWKNVTCKECLKTGIEHKYIKG